MAKFETKLKDRFIRPVNNILFSAALIFLAVGQVTADIRVVAVDDLPLGAFDGINDLSSQTRFCVLTNNGDDYTMTITANLGSFVVSSATTGDTIGFSVKVAGKPNANNFTTVGYNTPSPVYESKEQSNKKIAKGNCKNGNAKLEVTFTAANLATARAASDYTATLEILVIPI